MYVKLSKDVFEQKFTDAGFNFITKRCGWEYVYVITSKHSKEIHVYSSIDVRTNVSRARGKDAIRFVLFDRVTNRPVTGTSRVNRTNENTIFVRIFNQIKELLDQIFSMDLCPKCGAALKEFTRKDNGNTFKGCSAYPNCGMPTKKSYPLIEPHTREIKIDAAGELQNKNSDFNSAAKNKASSSTIIFNELYPDFLSFNLTETDDNNVPGITPLLPESKNLDTKIYKPISYPFTKFNRLQTTLLRNNFHRSDSNLILGTTTSSGKTIAVEPLIFNTVKQKQTVVYVSPLKSLTQEKYTEWQERFPNLKICIMTGDYVLTAKRARELNKSHIICLTSEMLDSRTRNNKSEKSKWISRVGLVIVDEAHIIDTDRGHAVEVGLMRFSKLRPTARIAFLSATLPNVFDFSKWLTKLNGKYTKIINSNWRPTKLTWNLNEYSGSTYKEQQASKIEEVINVVRGKPDEKYLIFVHDKKTGRLLVENMKEEGYYTEFHSADANLDERLKIENGFAERKSGLQFLVSTSTLAWGRSLPARNVIIVGNTRGMEKVDEVDIIQMGGRAGRFGIDPCGDVFFICDNRNKWKTIIENPRLIKSTLLEEDVLGFHILAEMNNGNLYDLESLHTWFERSLATIQSDLSTDFTERVWSQLISMKMVNQLKERGDFYEITNLGRISAMLYFFPRDIYHWFKSMCAMDTELAHRDDLAIAVLFGSTPTQDRGYVPQVKKDEVNQLRTLIKNKFSEFKYFNVNATTLDFYKYLTSSKQTILTRGITFDIERIITAMQLIKERNSVWNFPSETYLTQLQTKVKYGVPWSLTELCTIPKIGAARAKKLAMNGIKTPKDILKKRNERKLISVLGYKLTKQITTHLKLEESKEL